MVELAVHETTEGAGDQEVIAGEVLGAPPLERGAGQRGVRAEGEGWRPVARVGGIHV